MRLLGLDPGLRHTGWGVIDVAGNSLRHVADGVIDTDGDRPLAGRLAQLYDGVMAVIEAWQPGEVAVEETFVNVNPVSTLKLGQARGAVILVPARMGLPVAEYKPNQIKKAIVGAGHADKHQVGVMVRMLLPGCLVRGADAADALAVAICHAHYRGTARRLAAGTVGAGAGATAAGASRS